MQEGKNPSVDKVEAAWCPGFDARRVQRFEAPPRLGGENAPGSSLVIVKRKIVLDSVGGGAGVNGIEGLMTVVSKMKTTTRRDLSMCWEGRRASHTAWPRWKTNPMQFSCSWQL